MGISFVKLSWYNATTLLMWNNEGLYVSHDTLQTWNTLNSKGISAVEVVDATIYIGTTAGIERSQDLGDSWLSLNIGLSFKRGKVLKKSFNDFKTLLAIHSANTIPKICKPLSIKPSK